MIISHDIPDIYYRCNKQFGVEWDKGIIITYGDTVYHKWELLPFKIAHEAVHVRQQTEMGAKEWWDKYFVDVEFRLSQEVEAYKAEADWIRENVKNRNIKFELLHAVARDLSSSIYGNIVTYKEALNLTK